MLKRIDSNTTSRGSARFPLRSVLALAGWRLRSNWLFLSFISAGMVAIVTLVCAIPLYSYVTTTAGLHAAIDTDAEGSFVTTDVQLSALSPAIVELLSHWANDYPAEKLPQYLTGSSEMVSEVNGEVTGLQALPPKTQVFMTLLGYSIPYASQHLQLEEGRLPDEDSGELEVVISKPTATQLQVKVGDTMTLPMKVWAFDHDDRWYDLPSDLPSKPFQLSLQAHIVGIYKADDANNGFWHGFDPIPQLSQTLSLEASSPPSTNIYATALASHKALLYQFYEATYNQQKEVLFPAENRALLWLHWFHQINTEQIEVTQIDDLVARLNDWQRHIIADSIDDGNVPMPIEYFRETIHIQIRGATLGLLNESTIESYKARYDVVNLPSSILLLEMTALALLFIVIMVTLMVERQANTIAVLRSRGATRGQIFASFSVQGVLLILPALLIGPLLSWLVTDWLVHNVLYETRTEAIQLLIRNPLFSVRSVLPYAMAAALCILLTMVVTLWGATRMNVLSQRNEQGRTQKRPLWQRLYLDLFAALLALVGYGIALYVTNTQISNVRAQLLAIAPLTLIAPVFLAIAGMLLLLRFFPRLLRLAARCANNLRGATVTLALEQMARAPRAPLRLTFLLTLACAFLLFSQVFLATQSQRLTDLATYETGAMFSGPPRYRQGSSPDLTEMIIKKIQGVQAVSAGCTTTAFVSPVSQSFSQRIEVRAVNTDTFANVATWTSQDDAQQITSQLQRLAAERNSAIKDNVVPALVDSALWNRLQLQPGDRFIMHNNTTSSRSDAFATFIAVGRINHIPTLHHTIKLSSATTLPTGILVDFRTYASAYQHLFEQTLIVNYVWLRTLNTPAAISYVRSALTDGKGPILFDQLYDYSDFVSEQQRNPLYLLLSGELFLGTVLLLIFALIGCLTTSWQHMRQRLTNFAILRALGTSPRQVIAIMAWEQGICYLFALTLGVGFGILLATTIIPFLIFSNIPIQNALGDSSDSTNAFYIMQRLFPVHISVPPSLIIIVIVLLLFTLCALLLMVWQSSRLILSRALRINED